MLVRFAAKWLRGFPLATSVNLFSPRIARQPLFLFIVAHGRSGSTLLQNILASQQNFHIVGENNNVLHALLTAYERASQAKEVQGTEPRHKTGDPWRGIHLIDTDRFGRELARLFVKEFVRPPRNAQVIGFKEIRYIDYPDVLSRHLLLMKKLFDPALIVFNKRDPVQAGKSLSNKWWKDMPLDNIISELEAFNRIVDEYAECHPNGSMVVKYDDYVNDPSHLRSLFLRLGIPFNAKSVDKIMRIRLDH